jgi:putative Mn2+ efflux pump MntP
VLVLASFFGLFQMIMPVIGWFAGIELEDLIKGIDHWIAFGLLVLIGSSMIFDSTRKENSQGGKYSSFAYPFDAIHRDSIDALMVGLSLVFLQTDILTPIVVIGIVTFSFSFVGFLFGNVIGGFFGKKIKAIGGIILPAI